MKTMRFFAMVMLSAAACIGAVSRGETLIDYETGETFEVEDSEFKQYFAEEIVEQDNEGMTVEYVIRYAHLQMRSSYGTGLMWIVPFASVSINVTAGEPQLCFLRKEIKLPKGFVDVAVSVEESEFKDFDAKLAPSCPPLADHPSAPGPSEIPDITPYEGFFPEQLPKFNKGRKTLYTAPIQYDMQNEVVRAYRRIKLRVTYLTESAIEAVGCGGGSAAVYYDVYGRKVVNPKKGCFYVEVSSGRVRSVVY